MCLSTVYKLKDGEKEKICEYVSGVRNSDGEFVFTDVMGEEKTVPGKLSSIDLIKNEIIIED
ncbi:MAG: CooT family nickel-binding protein [Firmicutes bacterium]|nr:CooT family nickel-binding protein [Bacillota bacterium]